MTHECTLKEAFIIKALDEIQPDWRTGADVRRETKDKIRERVAKKYADIFDPDDSACITIRSIELTVTRIRNKLEIPSRMDSVKKLHTLVRAGNSTLDSPPPKSEPPSDVQATAEPGKLGEPAEPNEPVEPSEPGEPHEPGEPSKEPEEEESEPSALEIVQSIANQEIQQEPEKEQEPEEEQETIQAQVASKPSESDLEPKPELESEEEMEKDAKEHSRDTVIAKLKQEDAQLKAELEQPVEEDKPVKEGEYPPDYYFYCLGCHESFKIGDNTKCPLCGSEKIVESDMRRELSCI